MLASNGIIHVIDKVLLPPAPPQNLVDTASADSSFSTLVELVAAVGLVNTLQDDEFTGEVGFRIVFFIRSFCLLTLLAVLAPTNSAFAKIGTVDQLKGLPNLRNILLYHVIPRSVYSED